MRTLYFYLCPFVGLNTKDVFKLRNKYIFWLSQGLPSKALVVLEMSDDLVLHTFLVNHSLSSGCRDNFENSGFCMHLILSYRLFFKLISIWQLFAGFMSSFNCWLSYEFVTNQVTSTFLPNLVTYIKKWLLCCWFCNAPSSFEIGITFWQPNTNFSAFSLAIYFTELVIIKLIVSGQNRALNSERWMLFYNVSNNNSGNIIRRLSLFDAIYANVIFDFSEIAS